MTAPQAPRVVLVSQWPGLKNAEYELIERVKRTGFDVAVVDFLGFDVASGECLNDPRFSSRYDFAVSFHYETPKFLDLPTFFWVANPLEFMHGQGTYRTRLIHHIRAYDDYLYNGSEVLKEHIRRVVGHEWRDTGLAFIGACSRNAMLAPRAVGAGASAGKIFYCGVNWEAITDKAGRAQGLLDLLQARDAADFYGPRTLLGVNTWQGFTSYRGEIPFDGVSIFPAMHEYEAVLAVSSPAHIKSQTSSGRAVEGFAAGVPVISDENVHVRHQFGDLPYYFRGDTEEERAAGVLAALDRIRSKPEEVRERVAEAQRLISTEYCFEVCLERTLEHVRALRAPAARAATTVTPAVEVFLIDHDPYAREGTAAGHANAAHVQSAAAAYARRHGVQVRVVVAGDLELPEVAAQPGVEWVRRPPEAGTAWRQLRLGQKLARLARGCKAPEAVFLTQDDFPHHDYLLRLIEAAPGEALTAASAGGFFVNDLAARAPASAHGILANNSPASLYRWSPNSVAEHHLGQFRLGRAALDRLDFGKLERFDVMLPLALALECRAAGLPARQLRHVVLRVGHLYLHKYQRAFARVAGKGYWAQQYELLTNSAQELNALYDAFHEDAACVALLDRVVGYDAPPVDPAVHTVNAFIQKLLPFYNMWLGFKRRVLRRKAAA